MADATNTAAEPSFREQVEKAEAKDNAGQRQKTVLENYQDAPQTDAAPTPDERAAPQESEETKPKVEKVVPLSALHEARAQAKEYRRQAEEFRRQQSEMMQYMAQQQAWQNQQQQPKPAPIPEFQQDPLGNMRGEIGQTREQLQALVQNMTASQQQAWQRDQQAVAEYQFRAAASQADAEFTAQEPDAPTGINFLKSQRVAQYEAGGLSRQQAQQRMLQDERDLVAFCLQNGENPAERAYAMAKAAGYVPAKQKMAMQRDGQGSTLPNASSGVGGGRLSLDALAKLKGTDFLDATKGGKWKQMMRDR